LADTGQQLEVSLRLPVLAGTGVIEPGAARSARSLARCPPYRPWQTTIKVITTGVLAVLLVGAAIKLKLMGGPQ
jgi:hypothetical protein